MALLALWLDENYYEDWKDKDGYIFNSQQPILGKADGKDVWLVCRVNASRDPRYFLAGYLASVQCSQNTPSDSDYHNYGQFRVTGDSERSRYFYDNGQDFSSNLLRLKFEPYKPINPLAKTNKGMIGRSLQSIRWLSDSDARFLQALAKPLRVRPLPVL